MIIGKARHGFTMVEIIIVVVMLGIMASVALPKIIAPNERVRASEGMHILSSIKMAQQAYALDHGGTYLAAGNLGSLDIVIPQSLNFAAPDTVDGTGGFLATIARCTVAAVTCTQPGRAYTLKINTVGKITCTPDAATCAGVCRGGGLACN